MAVYSPFSVGTAQGLFGTKYPPQYISIGNDPSSWSFGILQYPAPFRSFVQATNDSTQNLGQYCRQLGGESGRLIVSTLPDSSFGQLGYVQQCWYGFDDGPNATDQNGNLYPSKAEWWNGYAKTYVIYVLDLMTDSHPMIPVEVAIGSDGPESDDRWSPFTPAYNIFNGLSAILPLDYGDCGATSGSNAPTYPFEDVGWTLDGLPSPLLAILSGPLKGVLNQLIDSFPGSGPPDGSPAAPGGPYSPDNIDTTLTNLLDTKTTQAADLLDNLTDWLLEDNGVVRFKTLADFIMTLGAASEVFIDGFYLPNLRYGEGTSYAKGLDVLNPYNWRPSDDIQQRFASYLLNNVDGTPFEGPEEAGPLEGYIPLTTPNNPQTGRGDLAWKLTLLNRGGGATNTNPIGGIGAWIDTNTNEFVIPETYGFARGGSVESVDNIIQSIEDTFGNQVADSAGVFFDMFPATPFFVAAVVPIIDLERLGRMNKEIREEEVNPVTNLDGLNTTYIDVRISAENLKEGNPEVYNYLVNSGQLNPVP